VRSETEGYRTVDRHRELEPHPQRPVDPLRAGPRQTAPTKSMPGEPVRARAALQRFDADRLGKSEPGELRADLRLVAVDFSTTAPLGMSSGDPGRSRLPDAGAGEARAAAAFALESALILAASDGSQAQVEVVARGAPELAQRAQGLEGALVEAGGGVDQDFSQEAVAARAAAEATLEDEYRSDTGTLSGAVQDMAMVDKPGLVV